jgi:hypothetical protein
MVRACAGCTGDAIAMSQASKLMFGFLLFLGGVTVLHGTLNLGWLVSRSRAQMTIGHLPVT